MAYLNSDLVRLDSTRLISSRRAAPPPELYSCFHTSSAADHLTPPLPNRSRARSPVSARRAGRPARRTPVRTAKLPSVRFQSRPPHCPPPTGRSLRLERVSPRSMTRLPPSVEHLYWQSIVMSVPPSHWFIGFGLVFRAQVWSTYISREHGHVEIWNSRSPKKQKTFENQKYHQRSRF